MTGQHSTRLHLLARRMAEHFCETLLFELTLSEKRCLIKFKINLWCCALTVSARDSQSVRQWHEGLCRPNSGVRRHQNQYLTWSLDFLRHSLQPHLNLVTGLPATTRWLNCFWLTILRGHFWRSVLDDGVMVIDGSELGPYRHPCCEEEAYFSSCWLCVPIASLFKSCSRSRRGRVSLAPWTRALLQLLRRSLLHVCTVMCRLSLTDIGTGVWSQEEFALPI